MSPVWQRATLSSPHLGRPVAALVARDVPYAPGGNRLQKVTLYLPHRPETDQLLGAPATALPPHRDGAPPNHLVHVHGGAWRDPATTAATIEATVAHAFAAEDAPFAAVASIDYTLSPFPDDEDDPYDPVRDEHRDPAREAVHPGHVADVLRAFSLLRRLGVDDGSYVLTSHSCGACIAFQAVLRSPAEHGLTGLEEPPRPAALFGVGGLYDLPALVHALGPVHAHLRDDYDRMLRHAFGDDPSAWLDASPARFDVAAIARRVAEGGAPRLVVLDHSADDQLAPANQTARMRAQLTDVDGMQLRDGDRAVGDHFAAWRSGTVLWQSVQDILQTLAGSER